jgi:hypothetical protein
MSTIAAPDRFTTLPDEQTLASAVTSLPGLIHIVLVRQVVGF